MRKQVFGRQLQRDTNERKALFKSLMNALVIHESIQTTEAKARAIQSEIEKMVTKAKKNTLQAERMFQAYFSKPTLRKFFDDVTPRFADRLGGYTRIIKIGNRLHDNAKMVLLEWVEKKPEIVKGEVVQTEETKGAKPKEKNGTKKETKTKAVRKTTKKEKKGK